MRKTKVHKEKSIDKVYGETKQVNSDPLLVGTVTNDIEEDMTTQ